MNTANVNNYKQNTFSDIFGQLHIQCRCYEKANSEASTK